MSQDKPAALSILGCGYNISFRKNLAIEIATWNDRKLSIHNFFLLITKETEGHCIYNNMSVPAFGINLGPLNRYVLHIWFSAQTNVIDNTLTFIGGQTDQNNYHRFQTQHTQTNEWDTPQNVTTKYQQELCNWHCLMHFTTYLADNKLISVAVITDQHRVYKQLN